MRGDAEEVDEREKATVGGVALSEIRELTVSATGPLSEFAETMAMPAG
jgi:hypothetical protein